MNQSADNIGYGQQTPWDADSDFNATAFLVRQMIAQLDTMKLVQVKAVTGGGGALAAAGTVDVLPLVNQIDGNGNATPHGTVFGIPWWRLQGGSSAVICDPVVGDIGYVICADRDIQSVKANKAVSNPGSLRKYDIADGIYVGGCLNAVPTQYISFTSDGVKVVDLNGNVLEMTASGFALTGDVAVTGNITATGEITRGLGGVDQVTLGQHVHASNGTPPTPGT